MLRILNKLTLDKELQTFVTNNVFLDKKVKTHKKNKKHPIQTRGLNPGPLAPKRMRYHCTTE